MEVAAAISEKAKSVTVICRDDLPFKAVLGSYLARKILQVGLLCIVFHCYHYCLHYLISNVLMLDPTQEATSCSVGL